MLKSNGTPKKHLGGEASYEPSPGQMGQTCLKKMRAETESQPKDTTSFEWNARGDDIFRQKWSPEQRLRPIFFVGMNQVNES